MKNGKRGHHKKSKQLGQGRVKISPDDGEMVETASYGLISLNIIPQ